MSLLPATLIIAALVQVSCQIFKLVYYSIKDRKLEIGYFTATGGIPSSHSAFVSALSVTVGIRNGFTSDIFAVSAVFSIIVMYDALRLRGVVQQQSKLLNRLTSKYHPEEYENLREMVGHTPVEIAAGVLVGGSVSSVLSLWVF
ncbi:MAG: divergent PAP2 family protein [Spirochaetia bacterium]